MKKKWQKILLDLSEHVSKPSKDKSRKVGCVIVDEDNCVLSTGYNGFPKKVNDNVKERNERPLKYDYTIHAEMNAICIAAKKGMSLSGSTLVCNLFPCANCAKHIVQVGIKKIVTYKPDLINESKYRESWKIALTMFNEAGVKIIYY